MRNCDKQLEFYNNFVKIGYWNKAGQKETADSKHKNS